MVTSSFVIALFFSVKQEFRLSEESRGFGALEIFLDSHCEERELTLDNEENPYLVVRV